MRNYNITYEDMCEIPVPVQTNTYKPVKYCEIADVTLAAAKAEGLILINTSYKASGDGQIVTAYYDFNYGHDTEMGLRIAWQNSYNKQVSLKFAIGSVIYLCSNGAFFGDIGAFRKKHVGEIQSVTPEMVKDYISLAKKVYNNLIVQKEALKKALVGKKAAAQILGELYFIEDLLTETQIAIVKRELKNPTHNYGVKNTAWDLYNHVTFSMKGIHPRDYITAHTKIHKFFANKFDLPVEITETTID